MFSRSAAGIPYRPAPHIQARTAPLKQVFKLVAASVLALALARAAGAQQPQSVTRTTAIAAAIARGPRVAIARADSATARAELARARQFDNPTLALSFTKDAPQRHVGLDLPLDFAWWRNPRIAAAQAGLTAATLKYTYEREVVAFDADTIYTVALAAAARARLSHATAHDADSLLVLARIRRDAGDGSELDVQLAALTAGTLANAAAADSIDAISGLLLVQSIMGMSGAAPSISLADSLEMPAVPAAGANGTPLSVASAEATARAAELGVLLGRRQRFGAPSLTFGFDQHDPGGQGNGILPMIGVSVPLPILNHNEAAVQIAEAERDRAQAELALARIESSTAVARARRDLVSAQSRAARSGQQVAMANSVAAMSLLAYREGAAALPSVLEAQRTAREALATYVNDVAAARNAASLSRLLDLTAMSANNPPIR
jgi:cobalt-zinc-cadmium efflux system outer membrane protein